MLDIFRSSLKACGLFGRHIAVALITALFLLSGASTVGATTITGIPTMSALQALTTADMTMDGQIYLAGYASGSTVGGGYFQWLTAAEASGLTPDGGVIIKPSDQTDCSQGCLERQFTGDIRTSFYGMQSGNDCTATLDAMYATAAELSGPNIKLMIDTGVCVITTTSAKALDTSTLPAGQSLAVKGPFIQPGLTYVAGGGSVIYANATYTTGQTFIGAPGYKFYVGPGAAYPVFPKVALKWAATSQVTHVTLEGPEYEQASLEVNGSGAGIVIYDPTTGRGPTNISLNNLTISGTPGSLGDGSPQVGVFAANWAFSGHHRNLYLFGLQVGLYCDDCWNQDFSNTTFGAAGAYAIFDNNNENNLNYVFLKSSSAQPLYTVLRFHDANSTNFVSGGLAINDQVWCIDQLSTGVLKGVVSSVGYWDGASVHNDMFIAKMNALSTSPSDKSQFSSASGCLFKSGALVGSQYTMDLNALAAANANSPNWYNDYIQTRLDSGAIYAGSSEGFNLTNMQASNWLGEAAFVNYDAPGGSGNQFGKIQMEVEGPECGWVDRSEEYATYTLTGTTPSAGTGAAEINLSTTIPSSTAGGSTSAFGLTCGAYGSYLNNSRIIGDVLLPHAAWGIILGPNTYNVDRSMVQSQLGTSSAWGTLDLQQGSGYPAKIITPVSEPTIYSSGTYSATPTLASVKGSRVFRSSSGTTTSYGLMATAPRSYVDLDLDQKCTGVSGISPAYIDLQFSVLADDNATVKFVRHVMVWSNMITSTIDFLGTIIVPANDNGYFGFQPVVVGTGWSCQTFLKQAQGAY